MDFTKLVRPYFYYRWHRTLRWDADSVAVQQQQLRWLLRKARDTEYGRRYDFASIAAEKDPYKEYSRVVPLVSYEDIRDDVLRMVKGERDILWPGRCYDFAQSSGTSGGKSKYIPITRDSLHVNHYPGASDAVTHYLHLVPESRLFAGKGFILGGSFSNTFDYHINGVNIGDLSATLINRINPLVNLYRTPGKDIALMSDWNKKLPELVRASVNCDVTNISGVPSWFWGVIKEVLKNRGVDNIHEVWPNLEVFFHGGISFLPYRESYAELTDSQKMHYIENYNASEGFFAVQNDFDDPAMLMVIDAGVFFEFMESGCEPVDIRGVEPGKIYELIITSCNGLWRYRIGDTIKVESVSPLKITIAGRTNSFINAFGEELMEDNATRAIAAASDRLNVKVKDFTAGPVYADRNHKGRHQWLIEWLTPPVDVVEFAVVLDEELRKLNSDYDAKRSGDLFMEMPEVITVQEGVFDNWLLQHGNSKLGGQRKIPRLSNNRKIIEEVLIGRL